MASFRGLNDKTIIIIILTTVGISVVFLDWMGATTIKTYSCQRL